MQRVCVSHTDSLMKSGRIHRFFYVFRQSLQILCRNQARGGQCRVSETLRATRRLVLLESSLVFLLLFLENSIEDQGCNQQNDQVQCGK